MNNLILTSISLDELKQIVIEALKEQSFATPSHSGATEHNDLLSINEAVKLLKVSKPTLWSYTKEGLVQKHRLGSKIYYKKSELLSALQQVQFIKHKKRF